MIALNAIFLLIVLREVGLINISFKWAFLNPQGFIALQERRVLIIAVSVMLVVAIPLLTAIFWFAYKYRATATDTDANIQAEYNPEWNFNPWVQFFCWAIPIAVIAIIGVFNWTSTHALDPSRPIVSDQPPITIKVVALQWKWLFIYPGQNIATVNFLEIPENTPVNFDLTADAPMNSFWIPQLGSQIYEMPGMETHLHLIANKTGDFNGSDAEISGAGFASMKFITRSASQSDFDAWVSSVKNSANSLGADQYKTLTEPSTLGSPIIYASVQNNLFEAIMAKYMLPTPNQMSGEMSNSMGEMK